MPRLDRFAPTATRFTRAFAGAPTTFPALPQVLTGSYFPESRTAPGLTGLLDGVAPEATRAIVGDALAAAWIADEHPGFGTVVRTARGARDLTSDALRFLTALGRCSTSLYVHYGRTDDTPRRSVMRRTGTDEARIAAIDRAVARLLRGVTRRGRLEDTVVMVVGMPGAAPDDADATSLRDAALHVPFLARFPGTPPGERSLPVGTIDVVAFCARRHGRTPSRATAACSLVRGAAAADGSFSRAGHGRRRPAADGALVDAELVPASPTAPARSTISRPTPTSAATSARPRPKRAPSDGRSTASGVGSPRAAISFACSRTAAIRCRTSSR
jgi:hypothetical protein